MARSGAGAESLRAQRGAQRPQQQQRAQRPHQHHKADRGGAGIIEFQQAGDDQQRGDLGLAGQIAGDEDHRAIFPQRAGEGEAEAGDQRRADGGQQDAPEGLGRTRAQQRGRFLQIDRQIEQHRLHGSHHEGQADEDQRHHNPGAVVSERKAQPGERRADPASGGEQGHQSDARDGRGQGERQIHQSIKQAPAPKAAADQHKGQQQPQRQIDHRGHRRRAERQGEGAQHPLLRQALIQPGEAQMRGAPDQRGQRHHHQQPHPGQADRHAQPQAGQGMTLELQRV